MKRYLAAVATALTASAVQAESFGAWYVGLTDENVPMMFVTNDSGNLFGKWCDAGEASCYWLLVTKTMCEKGSAAPLLINVNSGAMTTTNTCLGERAVGGDKMYRTVLHKPDEIDKIVRENESIAIALALEGGNFRVLRFDLSQGRSALNRWEQLTKTMSPTSTKDKTL